jgi:hypothetical protein
VIPFHKLLIGTAIAFCALMVVWSGWRYSNAGGSGMLVLGGAFAVAGAALSYYLRHLKRFLGR